MGSNRDCHNIEISYLTRILLTCPLLAFEGSYVRDQSSVPELVIVLVVSKFFMVECVRVAKCAALTREAQ